VSGPSPACDACLMRSWLLGRLSGHLEIARARLMELLELPDDELIAAVGGAGASTITAERSQVVVSELRAQAGRAGLEVVCRCAPAYPQSLQTLPAPPAVLYVAGGAERLARVDSEETVAIVGSRTATGYGQEVARALAHDLATAGITIASGLARGIDAAAHEGALAAAGDTIAVLPGSAATPYPAGARRLHHGVVSAGCAISELGPGAPIRRWNFKARNRIVAGVGAMTVVVEAGERSGSLVTAELALESGRIVGAVPGRVTTPQAGGPNRLLAAGHVVVRGAQDVLDALLGVGVRTAPSERRPVPSPDAEALLITLSAGVALGQAFERARLDPASGLAALAELELAGWVRRGPGGGVTVVP
jgi:DNA processing protein